MNERTVGWDENAETQESVWALRALRWAAATWRPHLGWSALALCLLLAMLPALLLWENRWLRVPSLIGRLYVAGALAVTLVWLVGSWRTPFSGRRKLLRVAMQSVALISLSIFALSELLAGWLPGRALTDTLCEAVAQFTGPGREQEDDITMFVVERA